MAIFSLSFSTFKTLFMAFSHYGQQKVVKLSVSSRHLFPVPMFPDHVFKCSFKRKARGFFNHPEAVLWPWDILVTYAHRRTRTLWIKARILRVNCTICRTKKLHKATVEVFSELHKLINVKSDFIYYLWKTPVQMVKRWKPSNSAT